MKRTFNIQVVVDCKTIASGKEFLANITKPLGLGKAITHKPQKRSLSQNSTFHGWIGEVAEEAHKKGLTINVMYKEPLEIPITKSGLEDYTRRIIKYMYKHESTKKLKTKEFSNVVEILKKLFTTKLGSTIPFKYLDKY